MSLVKAFVLSAAFLLTPVATFAQTAQIQQALDNFIRTNDLPGISVHADDGRAEINLAAGIANLENNTQLETSNRFYIASSGKMMVAVAILSAVDEGLLDLDTLIWPLIGQIEGIQHLKNANKVTVRQLLNHTSGLAEYLSDGFVEESFETPSILWNADEALSFAYGLAPQFPPGTQFEYTNTNYVLLGFILQKLDGSLQASLQKRVFDKADMKDTTTGALPTDPSLARGYDAEGYDVSDQAWASRLGDGPVVSTAKDLGKFGIALFRDRLLLRNSTLNAMLTGSRQENSYGLGMGIDGDRYGEWFGHAGSYDGYEADMRYYPQLKLVITYLTNGNGESSILDNIMDDIVE